MNEKNASLAERLAALRSDYIRQLPGKMSAIEAAWQSLAGTAWDETQLAELHRLAHGLSGSGKTFGLEAVSDAARHVELYLKTVAASGRPATGPERIRLAGALQQLRQAIDGVAAA